MMCRAITETLDPTGIPIYESFQAMKEVSDNMDLKEAEAKIERLIKALEQIAGSQQYISGGFHVEGPLCIDIADAALEEVKR